MDIAKRLLKAYNMNRKMKAISAVMLISERMEASI